MGEIEKAFQVPKHHTCTRHTLDDVSIDTSLNFLRPFLLSSKCRKSGKEELIKLALFLCLQAFV